MRKVFLLLCWYTLMIRFTITLLKESVELGKWEAKLHRSVVRGFLDRSAFKDDLLYEARVEREQLQLQVARMKVIAWMPLSTDIAALRANTSLLQQVVKTRGSRLTQRCARNRH